MAANSRSAKAFRENVQRILLERQDTLTNMADVLGMSRPALSRVMHGHDGVTIDRAERIADYLRLPLAELLTAAKKLRQPA